MNIEGNVKKGFDELYNIFSSQGYITSNNIFVVSEKYEISLTDTEYLCNDLANSGVFIASNDEINNYSKDYSFSDYNEIFDEVLKIDNNLKYIISQLKIIKPPQKREFETLFIQAKNGNEYARNRIIKMNMRTAVRHALYFYRKYNYPLDIAIQESFIGLIKALNNYSIGNGSFQNYSQWYIRQSLYRSLPSTNILFECPLHLRNDLIKLLKHFKHMNNKYLLKNKINVKRYIKKVIQNPNKSKIQLLYLCLLKPYSINFLIENEKKLFSDKYQFIDDLNENITNQYLHEIILNVLSTFPMRESNIIKLRFGLGIMKSHTLDEIGDKYNLTRERIRQIIEKAIRRFRHPKRARKILIFFDYKINEPSDKDLPKNQKFLGGN
jgi:RNA polymerase primary sigma factor